MWQDDLSVEDQVARSMGDEDFDEEAESITPVLSTGCSRAKTLEIERPIFTEAEPVTVKYNRMFD
jgi:hypothetical protein